MSGVRLGGGRCCGVRSMICCLEVRSGDSEREDCSAIDQVSSANLTFIGGMGLVSRLPWKSGQEWPCWSCCTGRSTVPFSPDQRRTTLDKMKHYSPSLLSDQQTKSQTTKHPLQRPPPPLPPQT